MNETNADKKQFRLDQVEAASRSDINIAQYPKQHNIKAQRLYQWRNIIKNSSISVSAEEKFTRVITSTPLQTPRIILRLSAALLDFDTFQKLLLAERKTVGRLQKQIDKMLECIRLARHRRFGASSKKHQAKASCSMRLKTPLMKLNK